ncbi:MAG: Colicin receptor precursor [Bacteroidota bacterium]|nr:Colicin receptor precursor [Bacteroidota bacterium]
MKKTLLLWVFGLLLTTQVIAQNRTLTGTVKDATNEALIGVNVTGKGTTIGTVTDIDGKYTLELPKEVNTLVFSYVGYTNIEKPILTLHMDVVMTAEGKQLEEVVISALNVQRQKSTIIYSQTTVTNEDLNKVANKSVLSALQGKVAGLNITSASGAVGASTRVILRGETSVKGNNNALLVVDGIPINNGSTAGGTGIDRNGVADRDNYVDYGNRGNDINPDDVETVNVLKGAGATALYGSKGANGVILITTKHGKMKKDDERAFRVSIGSSFSFETPYIILKRQDKWGSGYASAGYPFGAVGINMGENFSWGQPFDGVPRPWTSLPLDASGNILPLSNGKIEQLVRPYSAVKNQLASFFDLGTTNKNSVSFEGGNDKYQFYVSYVNTNQKGAMPNTNLKKNSVLLNANADFSDKINVNFSGNYTNLKQRGATEGGYPFGQSTTGLPAYAMALQSPVNIPFRELRDYNSPYYDLYGYYGQYTANPYMLLGETENTNTVDNFIGKVEINYKPAKGLTLTARAGSNFLINTVVDKTPQYQYSDKLSWVDGFNSTFNGDNSPGNKNDGAYSESVTRRNILTVDILATYNSDLGKKKLFNIHLLGGLSSTDERSSNVNGATSGGLIIPGYYNFLNSVNTAVANNTTNTPYRLMGLLGNISVGYKNVVSVEYSARNDWSSRLAPGKNSFFYQSGGLSFRPLELMKTPNKWFTYLKLRADIGTEGSDPFAQYLTSSYFTTNGTLINNGGVYDVRYPFNGNGASRPSITVGNPELKPELTVDYEGGIDLGFFKDRLNIEYTYYDKQTKNEVVDVDLPPSSGYRTAELNVGKISNKGHELQVRAIPYKNSWIEWSLFGTFQKNKSKVIKVSDATTEAIITQGIIPYAANGTAALVLREGMPYGVFKVTDYLRDPNGNIVVNAANGIPIQDKDTFSYVSSEPKFKYSFGTDLVIKGLSIHVLFDGKVGGKFISISRISTDFNGTALETGMNNREAYLVPNSVVLNADGTYSPNVIKTTNYQYFNAEPAANAIVDGSYLKLREVAVSYTLPTKAFGKAPIKGITIGVFGRNLKYWLAKSNQFSDPETSGYGLNGNAQNIESQNTPSTRSYGFDFRINF